ncbi:MULTISPECIES: glutathione S-transferase family protein [unclassified Leptolyngbya]|uniref:glutathione S-transferase family protein n=1 Tax=unclassified Leptolyngbya TaxID=2650499 RepID=UPI001685290F|nr:MULTISPECIES: glutathione S-transferase family protein [unclassified Leptolyngbya]MBD1913835.1 glutathione S-transferase family protein [Leptolyngbya sp. FACHB-8]MBD2157345.1 glutathione S-transferase family protein [Leptolyngbya sp. FACHB-16]
MLLLQFSTSHYCRKARLALGYKGISYRVENLTPGIHALKLRPLTGLTTTPVLLPEVPGEVEAIADSTHILTFLDRYQPDPPLFPTEPNLRNEVNLLEDWLDESIGVATRFVYYDYRSGEGKALDPSLASQAVIQIVRKQYGMTPARVTLASDRLANALDALQRWEKAYLVGDRFTAADLTAAALLSPLARLPYYRQNYPWLFARIIEVHERCHEPLPPGLETDSLSV